MIQYKELAIGSQGAAGPPARLDNSAISGRLGVDCRILPGGVVLKQQGVKPVGGVPGLRGPCKGFSARSRRRMMERQIAVDWAQVAESGKKARSGRGFLVTLTYGDAPADRERLKADLQAWKKRMLREFGLFGGYWKLELQKRGVPHYHVALFFKEKETWNRVRTEARKAWVEITGAKVVDCQTIYAKNGDYGRLMRYLAKYLGKPWESDKEWGRVWGVWVPAAIPLGEEYIAELTWNDYIEFCRRVRRWGSGSPYLEHVNISKLGLLIYGAQGRMVQLLRGLEFVENEDEQGTSARGDEL